MKNIMRSICTLVILASTQPIFSQPTGLPFLKLGVGAQSQALGGAYIAKADNASATYWNPSALANLQSSEIHIYHNQYIIGSKYNYIAYAHPFKSHQASFGLAIGNLTKGTFEGRDRNRQPTGEFSATDNLVSFSYGRRAGTNLSLGASVKILRSNIGSYNSNGIAMDLSSTYQFSAKTRLAFGVYHLGPQMRYMNESFNLPATFSAGISRQLFGPISISADARYGIYDQKFNLALGGEMNLGQVASLRMGYLGQNGMKSDASSASAIGGGLGMGLGVKIFKKTDLDYAFIPMGELGGTHHMSLNWRFK